MDSKKIAIKKDGVKSVNKFPLFKAKKEKTLSDHTHNFALEFFAIFLWSYLLLKVFVFDVDVWLFQKILPEYVWLLNFKSIFILGLIAMSLIVFRNRYILIWFLYITFYPLVLLIKIPIFVFKQKSWTFAFTVANSLISFFKTFKRNFITTVFFLISFVAVLFFSNKILLIVAVVALLLLVLNAYIQKFLSALRPSGIFRGYTKIFKGIRKISKTSFELDEEIKNLPVESLGEKQLEKWTENLQISVLFNRLCLFTATKLRDYQKSEWRIVPSILNVIYLIIYSIISFSGVYFALFKINENFFSFSAEPSFFTFFYFSFNNIIFNATSGISASLPITKSIYMFQIFLMLILGLILVTLIISHRTQKYSQELDQIIEDVEKEAKSMEDHIQKEFGMENIQHAMTHLENLKSSLIKLIYGLSGDNK